MQQKEAGALRQSCLIQPAKEVKSKIERETSLFSTRVSMLSLQIAAHRTRIEISPVEALLGDICMQKYQQPV
jgi:hypothetical protein